MKKNIYSFLICFVLFIISILITIIPRQIFAAQLSEEDIAKKNEGWYVVGLPLINASSDDGVGYGARVYLYNNGNKSDVYYDSTPYFFQLYAQFFQTTRGFSYHTLDLDMPYLAGTKFRLKSSLVYDVTKNANFFGVGKEASEQKLTDENGITYDNYQDYNNSFLNTGAPNDSNRKYNNYTIKRPTFLINIYRDITESIKVMMGFQFMNVNIESWNGRSFNSETFGGEKYNSSNTLFDLYNKDTLTGYEGGWTNFIIIGVSYDTRDFEPNPKNGVLCEYIFLLSNQALGSDYNFHTQTASIRGFYSVFKRLTLSGRISYLDSNTTTPFYELGNFNYFKGRQKGIGGNRTNLGYKSQRFIGNTMTIGQAEFRYFVGDTVLLGSERFGLQIVAFSETGNVYDSADEVYSEPRWKKYKTSFGGGAAIPWNLSTIIHIFFGVSSEDTGFSVDFDHKF